MKGMQFPCSCCFLLYSEGVRFACFSPSKKKKGGGAQYPYWFYLFKEGGHLWCFFSSKRRALFFCSPSLQRGRSLCFFTFRRDAVSLFFLPNRGGVVCVFYLLWGFNLSGFLLLKWGCNGPVVSLFLERGAICILLSQPRFGCFSSFQRGLISSPPRLYRGEAQFCVLFSFPEGAQCPCFFPFLQKGGGNRGGFFSLYIRRFHSFPLVLSFSPLFLVSPFGDRTRKQNGLKRWEGGTPPFLPF